MWPESALSGSAAFWVICNNDVWSIFYGLTKNSFTGIIEKPLPWEHLYTGTRNQTAWKSIVQMPRLNINISRHALSSHRIHFTHRLFKDIHLGYLHVVNKVKHNLELESPSCMYCFSFMLQVPLNLFHIEVSSSERLCYFFINIYFFNQGHIQ